MNFHVCSMKLNGSDERVDYKNSFEYLSAPRYLDKTDKILLCPGDSSVALLDTHTPQIDTLLTKGDPSSPVSSPDGAKIYYISDISHTYDYEIWSMKADGTDFKQLTHLHSYLQDLQMSPNGEYLYFRSDPGRVLKYDLYRMNISTGKISKICNAPLFHDNTIEH